MTWSIGKKIGSGFGLALVMLTVVGAVSYDSTTKLIASAGWVQHITGEARYLEPYQGARDVVDQKLKRLRELTSDNPIQQKRLTAIEPPASSKFAELQETIDLRRTKGFAAAEQVV